MPNRAQKRYAQLIILAGVVIALDQLVKMIVLWTIPAYHSVSVIPGFFNITHIYNTGGAFGFLSGSESEVRRMFFLVAPIAAAGLILFLYTKMPPGHTFLEIAFSLILGGAAGNVIDRVRIGKVLDFLDFHVMGLHWPSFNIADSAITVGMLIFVYHLLFKKMPL